MTRIKNRQVIFQDEVLQRKVERWAKQCGGKTERDIAKVFVILNMKFPIMQERGLPAGTI